MDKIDMLKIIRENDVKFKDYLLKKKDIEIAEKENKIYQMISDSNRDIINQQKKSDMLIEELKRKYLNNISIKDRSSHKFSESKKDSTVDYSSKNDNENLHEKLKNYIFNSFNDVKEINDYSLSNKGNINENIIHSSKGYENSPENKDDLNSINVKSPTFTHNDNTPLSKPKEEVKEEVNYMETFDRKISDEKAKINEFLTDLNHKLGIKCKNDIYQKENNNNKDNNYNIIGDVQSHKMIDNNKLNDCLDQDKCNINNNCNCSDINTSTNIMQDNANDNKRDKANNLQSNNKQNNKIYSLISTNNKISSENISGLKENESKQINNSNDSDNIYKESNNCIYENIYKDDDDENIINEEEDTEIKQELLSENNDGSNKNNNKDNDLDINNKQMKPKLTTVYPTSKPKMQKLNTEQKIKSALNYNKNREKYTAHTLSTINKMKQRSKNSGKKVKNDKFVNDVMGVKYRGKSDKVAMFQMYQNDWNKRSYLKHK